MLAAQSTEIEIHFRSVIRSTRTWDQEEIHEYGCWYATDHMLRHHPDLLGWLNRVTPGWEYKVDLFPDAPESPSIIRPPNSAPLVEISVSLKFQSTKHALLYRIAWGIPSNRGQSD